MTALVAAMALAATAPKDMSGVYHTHQMEVGAELVLKPDGSFVYSLDYGAVSEAAKGHWSARNGVIHLDSEHLPAEVLREAERSDGSFADEKLTADGSALILHRWDTVFTFYRDDE